MKNLEKIAVFAMLAAVAWFFFTRGNVTHSISMGGGDSNGLPYFLTYNMPARQASFLPLPALNSNPASKGSCFLCGLWGNSNTVKL